MNTFRLNVGSNLGLILLFAGTILARATEAMPVVDIRELDAGVWLHTTWGTYRGNPVPSNGLIVRRGDHLVLIDTGWGEAATDALLDAIQKQIGRPVTTAIITHAHEDRIGGAAVLARHGIVFYASPLTVESAARQHLPKPTTIPGLIDGPARLEKLELYYPGPAHTVDNIVVWIPEARILFGGCMVRAADATTMGNIADADLKRWPTSTRNLLTRYSSVQLVVPGHGSPGSIDLLTHTLKLSEAAIH